MKKKVVIILSFFSAFSATAQVPSIDAGDDQSVCPPECVTITAVAEGGGGNTDNYEVEFIDYAPDSFDGTAVDLFDDDVTDPIAIGFDFCFYGETYSEMYIGSNGWVGFSGGPVTYTSSTIPSADPDVPDNCIMGPWYDIDPGFGGGEIRYQLLGVAPVRRMVISYIDIPHFLCDDHLETYQIILYESTNIVENHITQKDACLGWDDGQAVQGLHNSGGTEAVPVPGRNNTAWTTANDAVRYTPLGEAAIEWYEAGVLIGEGAEITLCPTDPTTYEVRLVSCGVIIATDEVFVDVSCCEPPIMSGTDLTCFGSCDGTATAVPFGVAPYTYLWDAAAGGQTTATAIGLCAGTYEVTVSDSEGCIQTGEVTIGEPDELIVDLTFTNVTCEGANDGTITLIIAGGVPPYIIDIGSGPSGITSYSDLTIGNYDITVIDDNGCVFAASITITDNPLPTVSFSADVFSGCNPVEITFTNTGDSGASCLWDFGDGSSSTSCDVTSHNYTTAGIYDVSLTVTLAGGCSTTTTYFDYIEVFPLPTVNFIFNPNSPTTINTEVNFSDYSTGATSWDWTFGDLGNSNEENPVYAFPEEEGTYDITLLIENEFGCTDELTKQLVVNQDQLIFVPNTITPDGDTFNEVFLPYFTGIDIYDYHLVIYNRWGEIIFESYNVAVGWNGTFGGEIVPDGVYIWQITTADIASDKKLEFNGHVTVLK